LLDLGPAEERNPREVAVLFKEIHL
jgi:hypothetical protein